MIALAIVTDGPTAGSTLALRVHAQKAAVLAELRGNPRFEQIGQGRGSRWRIAAREPQRAPWEPLGTDSSVEARETLGTTVVDRLDDLEQRVAELERRVAGVPTE
jgi:hypothetical protein